MTELQSQFRDRGFAGPLRVLTPTQCRRIVRVLRSQPQAPPLCWMKGSAVSSCFLFDLATSPAILQPIHEVLGDDVMLWGAMVVRRKPGQKHPWHTDIETSDPECKGVSVWIGIENTTQRSALQVLSHSHLFGTTIQQVAAEMGKKRGEATQEEAAVWAHQRDPRSGVLQLDMRDGDALLFDGRLWHGSDNRNRWSERTALLFQYATPDTPIRMPDPSVFEWPFRFQVSPRPPCVMVLGSDEAGVNRIVGPPTRDGADGPALSSWIRTLELPLAADERTGWRPHPIFRGASPNLPHLSCHVSVLSPGKTPHPPHTHAEEELLIMLCGEAELVMVDPAGRERTTTLAPRSFVYYPAGQLHTIRNATTGPATYLMFKWRGEDAASGDPLKTSVLAVHGSEPSGAQRDQLVPVTRRIFEGRTRYLSKLGCHLGSLRPGASCPRRTNAHDVAVLTLSGTVDTLGESVGPNSVVFYPAGEAHAIENKGTVPAEYLVFEFHRADPNPLRRRTRRRFRRLGQYAILSRAWRLAHGIRQTVLRSLGRVLGRA